MMLVLIEKWYLRVVAVAEVIYQVFLKYYFVKKYAPATANALKISKVSNELYILEFAIIPEGQYRGNFVQPCL